MNVLGWTTKEYKLGYQNEKLIGYVFTVDGKPLVFKSYIPLDGSDITEVDYLVDTQTEWCNAPYLACCNCGIIGCDAVHAVVKYNGDKVFWSVFRGNLYGDNVQPEIEATFCFNRTQYEETIKSLLEQVQLDAQ